MCRNVVLCRGMEALIIIGLERYGKLKLLTRGWRRLAVCRGGFEDQGRVKG